MTTPRFDLIVFDWDGTLMDSTAHIVHTIERASAEFDLPSPARERSRHVIGLSLVAAMAYVHPGLPEKRYEQLADAYRRLYYHGFDEVVLFDGVVDGLKALKDSGATLAIATGKGRGGLNRVLETTGLANLFAATRTVDECAAKPAPDMLYSLMEHLGGTPDGTVMIGDTSHDLGMARNAGVAGVGMSYGAHPIEELNNWQPLAVFDQFTDLKNWLLPTS